MDVFEFPVTVEDEELPKLGDRVPEAVELARQIGRYGGSLCRLNSSQYSRPQVGIRKALRGEREVVCLVRFRLAVRAVVGRKK